MSVNLGVPDATKSKLKPRIIVLGIGGGGCNALNTMIASGLKGVEFVACNTDSQSLDFCNAQQKIQLGIETTQGLGAGSDPSIGKSAAEESYNDICEYIDGAHMAFIAAGMGGGTGTGAISTIAKACKEKGILTVAVVTKPFNFEGKIRMENAEKGIEELRNHVDTIIIIPNQNLYIVCDDKTSYAEAFCMADQVLHAGVRGVTDLIMQPGLVNLDFADIRTIMSEMGRAVFGNGESAGERRAIEATEAAISNPLLERVSLDGAKGLLVNISGGSDMSLTEVEEAADRINQEINPDVTKSIFGTSINKELDGMMRVSVIATGIGSVIDMHNSKDANIKSQAKERDDNLLQNTINVKKPNFAEQTDLEDFTNPVVEIKKDFTNKADTYKKNDSVEHDNLQTKPDNIVLEFIKKFSPLKIFNFDKKKEKKVNDDDHSMDFLEKDNVKLNEDTIRKADEEVMVDEETIINHEVKNKEKEEDKIKITSNKEENPNLEEKKSEIKHEGKVEMKPQENENASEIKKDEKKTVQIQSEMPGLDENLVKEEPNDKTSKEKKDLEIPSFLRNQSN